jgi:hypothetical protein
MRDKTKRARSRPATLTTGSGRSVGQGHGGNSSLPVIRPIDLPPTIAAAQRAGMMEADLKAFKMGKLHIFVGFDNVEGWHLSISHPERYPTWDEIAKARYELVPDAVTMVMFLPPRAEYINIHNFCFQLREPLAPGRKQIDEESPDA